MRRTATAALTAALMVTGASAALAQPGPPSDIPAPPAQAQGSAEIGQDRSADARANAEGSPATGADTSADARANAEGSPATGAETSAAAREGGRDFGQQRATDARARGELETDVTEDDVTEDDGTEDDGTEDDGTEDDGTEDGGTEDDGTEDDADDDDLGVDGLSLDDVDLPAQGDEARGVLASITAALTTILETIQGVFGFGIDAA